MTALREAVRDALNDARFEETALRIMDADCDAIASSVLRAAVEGMPDAPNGMKQVPGYWRDGTGTVCDPSALLAALTGET